MSLLNNDWNNYTFHKEYLMAKRIPGLPRNWQEYFTSILLQMSLPLLPIGLELIITGSVEEKSLVLMASFRINYYYFVWY